MASSGTAGAWQKIQFFPTYTPVSGDKFYFSAYNPSNVGPGQLQFEYSSNPGVWVWGDNLAYDSGSVTGWVEYSVDLTAHVGNEINKVIVMPAGGSASAVYVDNIYFADQPSLSTDSVETFTETVFFDESGKVTFAENQTNTTLQVFDIYGRLIIKENVIGKKSTNTIENIGIYILRIKTGSNTFAVKKLMLR